MAESATNSRLAPCAAATTKVRNVVRGLIQRYAPQRVKAKFWDQEFSTGRWNCLDSMTNDCLYSHVATFANRGAVLDLGCGPGTTGAELDAASYATYTGVDISHVAIEKARAKAKASGRADKNSYVQGDLFRYVPTGRYDVIVFGDSLYYIPWGSILPLLRRYADYLNASGVFVVRIYGHRYQKIIDMIRANFDVLEQQVYAHEVFVLTFRVRRAST